MKSTYIRLRSSVRNYSRCLRKNEEIWPLVEAELRQRRFAAPGLSERQLRRIVYG